VAAEIWGAHAPRARARRLAERTFSAIAHRSAQDGFGEAPKPAREARALPGPARHAFTIIELLIVIAIILVLAGLILATSGYVQTKGKRSRAEAEIAAISAALENYKADNGIYPRSTASDNLDAKTSSNPTSYQAACGEFYAQLIGDSDYNDITDSGSKSYMTFKPNMKGVPDKTKPASSSNKTFAQDPFGSSYGYSTAYQYNSLNGYNPTFDLWSTAGTGTGSTPTPSPASTPQNQWIKNW
jgi:prepilin-type N-terminal cleavage/methylation domain-containing protein